MFYRADVIDNGIGYVWRMKYLSDIKGSIEQGKNRRSPDYLVGGVVAAR